MSLVCYYVQVLDWLIGGDWMPKETFLNLPKSKQAVIDDILLQTFCAQSISQVKV